MITTRALDGSPVHGTPVPGTPVPGASVISLHLVKQPGVIAAGEPLRGALVTLHRPRPEVHVERAAARLDRPPQRPRVLAGQPEQPRPRDLAAPPRPVILADQFRQPV